MVPLDIDVQLIGEVLHEAADLKGTGALNELTTSLHTLGVTGDVEGNGNHDGLGLVHGQEIDVEAVVLYRVPLILVCNGGVGLATQIQVNDVGSGGMRETLEFFLIDCEKDVVLNTFTVQIAGNQALAAEGLDYGLVALLADFALKRKMLHVFCKLKMCYSVLCFKHPIAPKNLCGFLKRAKVIKIIGFAKWKQ